MDKKGTGQEDPDKRNNIAMPKMGILFCFLFFNYQLVWLFNLEHNVNNYFCQITPHFFWHESLVSEAITRMLPGKHSITPVLYMPWTLVIQGKSGEAPVVPL